MFVLNCTKWRPAKRGNSSGKIHRRGIQENTDRWIPCCTDCPQRDKYFIGIETCVPEIEKERRQLIDRLTTV